MKSGRFRQVCLLWGLSLALGVALGAGSLRLLADHRSGPERLQVVIRLMAQGSDQQAYDIGRQLQEDPGASREVRNQAALLLGELTKKVETDVSPAVWYARVSSDSPRAREAGVLGGLSLISEGQLTAAELWFREHLSRFPDDVYVRNELRWMLFNQYRTRELEDLLTERISQQPVEQYSLLIELLTSEFRKQLAREGLPYLQEIDRRVPGQPTVQLAAGYGYWQTGNISSAKACFQAARQHADLTLPARLTMTEFELESGAPSVAQRLLEELRPRLAESETPPAGADRWWFLLGLYEEQQGRLDQAESALMRALQLRPAELEYVQKHGELLQQLGRTNATEVLLRANQLESVQSDLSELVLRGEHERPNRETCVRIAQLERARGRTISADGWERLAQALTRHPIDELLVPEPVPPVELPGGGGPM